jgi:hypothetical protein
MVILKYSIVQAWTHTLLGKVMMNYYSRTCHIYAWFCEREAIKCVCFDDLKYLLSLLRSLGRYS